MGGDVGVDRGWKWIGGGSGREGSGPEEGNPFPNIPRRGFDRQDHGTSLLSCTPGVRFSNSGPSTSSVPTQPFPGYQNLGKS